MLRNSDSHNEKYGWNSIPNSIPKNTLGGSRFNLEINGIFRCLDISFVSLPLNDVTRTSSWLSKSSLFATIDENGDEPRPHLQWWMHFWAEMPTAKSTRGMATTAPDEEPNRRESLFRLYTDIPHLKTSWSPPVEPHQCGDATAALCHVRFWAEMKILAPYYVVLKVQQ